MKAILRRSYGPAEVLEFGDVDQPAIKPGEVLVRVRAAGVDRGVWHVMTGLPYLGRLAFGLRRPRNPVLGMDVAGVVEAVGEEVTALRQGDEVFGTCNGAFAEYAAVREDRCAPKPAGMTFEQAAALPTSGVTALLEVPDGLRRPGERIGPVHGRPDGAALDQLPDRLQIRAPGDGDEEPHPLADDERQQHRAELAAEPTREPVAALPPDDDQRPPGREHPPEPPQ